MALVAEAALVGGRADILASQKEALRAIYPRAQDIGVRREPVAFAENAQETILRKPSHRREFVERELAIEMRVDVLPRGHDAGRDAPSFVLAGASERDSRQSVAREFLRLAAVGARGRDPQSAPRDERLIRYAQDRSGRRRPRSGAFGPPRRQRDECV